MVPALQQQSMTEATTTSTKRKRRVQPGGSEDDEFNFGRIGIAASTGPDSELRIESGQYKIWAQRCGDDSSAGTAIEGRLLLIDTGQRGQQLCEGATTLEEHSGGAAVRKIRRMTTSEETSTAPHRATTVAVPCLSHGDIMEFQRDNREGATPHPPLL